HREPLVARVGCDGEAVDRGGLGCPRCDDEAGMPVHTLEERGGGVEGGAVAQPARGPTPRDRPPVAHAPRMVALAPAVERDALVAHEHLAVDRARLLIAGHAGIPEDVAGRLPLELEPERGAVTPL